MSAIYCSGTTVFGQPLIAGLFAMKDQHGFPLDMSIEECRIRGMQPDWLEYLADAGRQPDWKLDAAVDEMKLIVGDGADEIMNRFKQMGALFRQEGDTFSDVCERIVNSKKSKACQTHPSE